MKYESSFETAEVLGNLARYSKCVTIVTTYNHGAFLKECVDSILEQDYEENHIVVHDDASRDSTKEYLLDLYGNHKDKVSIVLQSTNQFSQGVNITPKLILNTNSQYVAICNGDDFWTEKFKLKKQLELLDKDLNASLIFSNLNVVGEGSQQMITLNWYEHNLNKEKYYFDDLIQNNYIPSGSVVYRRKNLREEFLFSMNNLKIGDWALNALALEFSYGLLLNEKLFTYRIHEKNTFENQNLDTNVRELMVNSFFLYVATHLKGNSQALYQKELESRLLGRSTQENYKLTQENNKLTQENNKLTQENNKLTQENNSILNSESWSITQPVQFVVNLFRKNT